jgi:hypothetical protein
MFITVDVESGSVTLAGVGEFTSFHVIADPRDAPESSVGVALGPAGTAAGDDHVWIAVDAVRQLAGGAADPAWEESFTGMLDYAESKGWLDEDGSSIRAHISRTTEP